jgi:serine/threonine protein kinase
LAPSGLIAGDRSGPTAGALLSHYRLVEQLGAGGMGVVFRAVDTRLNRTVALKLIALDALAGDDRRQRFLREARAASAFNHPNIVTIHEVDQSGGTDFIVMELVAGQALDLRIRAGGLPVDDVLSCAEQIAAALEAAHGAGIVHRDIKPGNIMVSDTGHVRRRSADEARLRGGDAARQCRVRARARPLSVRSRAARRPGRGYRGDAAVADTTIARVKDFGRVLDFIEARPDLDRDRIGYYGLSLGAFTGVVATAIEPRVKASVLLGGGLLLSSQSPEIDPFNFAPHVRAATLMINGRRPSLDDSAPRAYAGQARWRDKPRPVRLPP